MSTKENASDLSRNLWLYLTAGAFWSCGLMAFFLVYNLYLLELGYQEEVMGRISGAMTLGSLAFTFPASWLLNRFGANRIIQAGVACTSLTLLLRALSENSWSLVLLAFTNGSTIAAWIVSTPPFLTQNVAPGFRSRAFSLSYGTSIGMGAISGFAVGWISRFLASSGNVPTGLSQLSIERMILVACAGCVFVAFMLVLLLREPPLCLATGKDDEDFVAPENSLLGGERRLQPPDPSRQDNPPLHPSGGKESSSSIAARLGRMDGSLPNSQAESTRSSPSPQSGERAANGRVRGSWQGLFKGVQSRPFIARLLVVLILWSLFVGSFSPFFNVFFHRQFNQSLAGIGIIFSLSQVCQLLAVLSMPWLVAKLGRVQAIASMQMLAAVFLPALLLTSKVQVAGLIYLTYLSFQVMSEPALENFIMDSVLPEERSLVSSLRYMILFLMQAVSAWATGLTIVRVGYSQLLIILAVLGLSASMAFYLSFRSGLGYSAGRNPHDQP